jgi:multidrug efflux pump subunit AcrA (membrane-fusion protein)
LAAGLYARVNVPGEARPMLLVPAAAVVYRGQLTGIYVVEEKILHYRLVKTGRTQGARVEILSGLNPGETIVTGGTVRARTGARVGG